MDGLNLFDSQDELENMSALDGMMRELRDVCDGIDGCSHLDKA